MTAGPEAGFQGCSQITMSVDVIEYRNGNDKENSAGKLTGLQRVSDITLQRQNEDHSAIAMTWKQWSRQDSRIAAGAVVYRDVPEQSLAAGNPAKVLPL